MAQRFCKDCSKSYEVVDGKTDPGFCSDRCFSSHNSGAKGPGWFWYVQLGLLVGVIALVVFRLDAAVYLAKQQPDSAPRYLSFLGWNGGDGIDRLIGLSLEGDATLRTLAVQALGAAPDPEDAAPRVQGRLTELKAAARQWDRPTQARLMVIYGRCGMTSELDTLVAALKERDMQLHAAQALGYLKDKRTRAPLLELLGQWEWELKEQPATVVALLAALAMQPDEDHKVEASFIPFLSHEKPAIRAAAAAAIEAHISEYPRVKEYLKTVPQRESYAIKQRLKNMDQSLAAVTAADQTEKDPAVKAALAAVVARSQADPQGWTR